MRLAAGTCDQLLRREDLPRRLRGADAAPQRAEGSGHRSAAPLDLDALLAPLRGVHGLGLGLVDLERVALRRREPAVEGLHGPLQALHGVVTEDLGLADGV